MFISMLLSSGQILTTNDNVDKIHVDKAQGVILEETEKNACGNAPQHRTGLVMLWYYSGLFGLIL